MIKTHHLPNILLYFTIIFGLEVIYVYGTCPVPIALKWCSTAHLFPTGTVKPVKVREFPSQTLANATYRCLCPHRAGRGPAGDMDQHTTGEVQSTMSGGWGWEDRTEVLNSDWTAFKCSTANFSGTYVTSLKWGWWYLPTVVLMYAWHRAWQTDAGIKGDCYTVDSWTAPGIGCPPPSQCKVHM